MKEEEKAAGDPSRFRLVYPNIQAVRTFFFLSPLPCDAMQNCQAKGGCRWESSWSVSPSLGGRARRRLLTLHVLEERHGAAAGDPGFPTGRKAAAAAARGREQGPEGKRRGGGTQRGAATQTNVAQGRERWVGEPGERERRCPQAAEVAERREGACKVLGTGRHR